MPGLIVVVPGNQMVYLSGVFLGGGGPEATFSDYLQNNTFAQNGTIQGRYFRTAADPRVSGMRRPAVMAVGGLWAVGARHGEDRVAHAGVGGEAAAVGNHRRGGVPAEVAMLSHIWVVVDECMHHL